MENEKRNLFFLAAVVVATSIYFTFYRYKKGCAENACAIYTVRPGSDATDRANTLARINADIKRLLDSAKDPRMLRIKSRFSGIKESLNNETYTFAKRYMTLCLKGDYNTLIFVVVHELAHMSSLSFGHGPEFRKNFRFLLDQAIAIGIYSPVDYRQSPTNYCGMLISTIP